jgi:predicted nucleic acid-binding protein
MQSNALGNDSGSRTTGHLCVIWYKRDGEGPANTLMDQIVSNSTPLIYLAKVNRLILLKELIENTIIPEAVYSEVVVRGKELGKSDASLVDRAVDEGWITVQSVKKHLRSEIVLHPGEMDVISLAKEINTEIVLVDDIKARVACELAGLSPRGTLWLLLRAIRDGILDFDLFLGVLEGMTRSGFYLKEDVYLRAVREAKKLSENI